VTRKTLTIEVTREVEQPMPLYHTIVHNCSCHTFDDVIFGLMRILGTGLRDAELKAKEVDFFGSGIVATTNLESAEMYAERLSAEVISASGTTLRTSIRPAV
jgi:ATP-dependent Clp protease adapter protein ClpS